MKKKIFIYCCLIISIIPLQFCQAQKVNKNCNRSVNSKEYEKQLIKEVCIPNGYQITRLRTFFKDIDLNEDGLGDFIFDWNKPELKDGDTLYITVYKMNKDSTYSFLKTFKNLNPLYFKSYDQGPSNPKYRKIYSECYSDTYPLVDLSFDKGTISLNIKIDAASGYLLNYQYDPTRKNWFLNKKQGWIDSQEGEQYTELELPSKPERIDDFSYEKYLCPDLWIEK